MKGKVVGFLHIFAFDYWEGYIFCRWADGRVLIVLEQVGIALIFESLEYIFALSDNVLISVA